MSEKIDIEKIRHSLGHVMAAAVLEMFPDAKFAIGPAIENGFYYDFDLKEALSPKSLSQIENKMREMINQDKKFIRKEVGRKVALELVKNQPYKTELINDLPEDEIISFYELGSFSDLCRGPHVESTKDLKGIGFKLDKLAGAYWRGSEKNKMLQRIYGLAFETNEKLNEYLELMKEAEKRDHKKLGKELGLFVFSELVGPGLPLYTSKGAGILRIIKSYIAELRTKIGYEEVQTPQINKADLFKKSGHYDKYKDDMFKVVSNYTAEEYYLKPMNCPQHTQIYASAQRSYKDLPVRIADFAMLYRDEKPGELSGLTRLRSFSQDDGHCFCREDQIGQEFESLLLGIRETMTKFGMDYYIRLSLRDENNKEKYLGRDEVWKKSQSLLEEILKKNKIDYVVGEGEAAFYGPKMDLLAKDSIGREWQLSTIQLDFNMPKRFDLEYVGEDGKKYNPVMIHSAFVGSPERFLGVLIEHYAGAFPFWLAPVQIVILPISEKHLKYSSEVAKSLRGEGFRVEIDQRNESIGKKIRESEMQKVPYMLIVGDKEVEAKKVAVRKYGEGDLGQMGLSELEKIIK